jgi:hypothetical protein
MVLSDLSDDELIRGLQGSCAESQRVTARTIAYLIEVEERQLHLRAACSSMFDFCLRRLGMSDSEAFRRLAAARLVKRFPALLGRIERGELHLSAVVLLRDHLTEENFDELVTQAAGKTKRELAELLARVAPRPDVPSTIRKLPPASSGDMALSACGTTPTDTSSQEPPKNPMRVAAAAHAQVEPLSPDRYKVQLTAGVELRDKLERARDLMRHRNPTGDLAVVVERALDLLLAKLEKERLGKTTRPRSGAGPASAATAAGDTTEGNQANAANAANVVDGPNERREAKEARATSTETPPGAKARDPHACAHRPAIPRAVRREVFARDGEQCTFVDPAGNRCPARTLLELDHVRPWSLGGSNDASNLRVTCRAHNQLLAEQELGKGVARFRRRQRGSRRSPAPATIPPPRVLDGDAFELATRGLVGMGFTERASRHALDLVCSRHATARLAIPDALREALGVLT